MKKNKSKGAALVEFMLVVPVIIAIWAGLYKLNSLYVIKQKIAVAARYGAWLDREGVSGELLQTRMLEEISTCKLIRLTNCNIAGVTKAVKPIYRDKENEVAVRYLADNLPMPAPLFLEEKFSLGHNSWITAPKRDRKLDSLKDKAKPKWEDIFF